MFQLSEGAYWWSLMAFTFLICLRFTGLQCPPSWTFGPCRWCHLTSRWWLVAQRESIPTPSEPPTPTPTAHTANQRVQSFLSAPQRFGGVCFCPWTFSWKQKQSIRNDLTWMKIVTWAKAKCTLAFVLSSVNVVKATFTSSKIATMAMNWPDTVSAPLAMPLHEDMERKHRPESWKTDYSSACYHMKTILPNHENLYFSVSAGDYKAESVCLETFDSPSNMFSVLVWVTVGRKWSCLGPSSSSKYVMYMRSVTWGPDGASVGLRKQ